MNKESYDRIREWFLRYPALISSMKALNLWLPRIVYCVYPLLLVTLAINKDERFLKVLLIPAIVFGAVTVLRELWDLPRPYEKLEITPLIHREKKGHSFPSRHVASATIIAVACWYIWWPLGIALSVITLLIAVIRPLSGIHYPIDVIAGALFSLVIGIIGFWLI